MNTQYFTIKNNLKCFYEFGFKFNKPNAQTE